MQEALTLKPRPRVIWMQLGVRNDEAAALAEANGLKVVMNRCPKIEYGRLSSEIGWMGVNSRTLTSKRAQIWRRHAAHVAQPRHHAGRPTNAAAAARSHARTTRIERRYLTGTSVCPCVPEPSPGADCRTNATQRHALTANGRSYKPASVRCLCLTRPLAGAAP